MSQHRPSELRLILIEIWHRLPLVCKGASHDPSLPHVGMLNHEFEVHDLAAQGRVQLGLGKLSFAPRPRRRWSSCRRRLNLHLLCTFWVGFPRLALRATAEVQVFAIADMNRSAAKRCRCLFRAYLPVAVRATRSLDTPRSSVNA